MQLAGVIGVGVERGHVELHVAAVETYLLPVESRGELQGKMSDGRFAVVAHHDERAYGDLRAAICRCTSISKRVNVMASRSMSAAIGSLAICASAGAAAERFVV